MTIATERTTLIFRKIERDLLRLRKSQEPETVHRFRTASRRLQVLLEELSPNRDRNQKKLLKLLRRIRKRAGRIRDLDIQLSSLRSLKMPLEPRRKTQLTHHLIELRHKHERKLAKLLTKNDVAEIGKRIRRSAKTFDATATEDPLKVARQMIASASRPTPSAIDDQLLHNYRTTVKRARYAAEFAQNSEQAEQLRSQLKGLQDVLGQWHDWFTLTETASHELGDITRSPLVAALHSVTRAKFRAAVAAITAQARQSESSASHVRKFESKTSSELVAAAAA